MARDSRDARSVTAAFVPQPGTRVALLVGYAVITFLSFPHPLAGSVIDLGLWLSWAAPAALLLGLQGLAPGRAARVAFLAGLLAFSGVLHWFYVVTVSYGHAPPWIGVLAVVGAALYPAVAVALFGGGIALFDRGRAPSPFFAAALWVSLDWLRSFFLTGFPWGTLGYAQHENAALLGLAPFAGVYGLSFATVLAGAALARGVLDFRRGGRIGTQAGVAMAVVLALHLVGWFARAPRLEGETIRVAALQGNIEQGLKWNRENKDRTFSIYEALSMEAAADGAELIVWPETALPQALRDGQVPAALSDLIRETAAATVVGAVGIERRPGGGTAYFDSAFVFGAEGEAVARYDKSHLVPFGEYVPLRDWLGGVLEGVATGIAPSDVSEGAGPFAIALPLGEGGSGRAVRVGVPICYELLFPDLVRRFVGDGAQILLALTNDAWYGRTGAPYQFLAMTALRSAETGVFTVRAANSGVSAIIDERGEVLKSLPIFERGWLVADVPLRSPARGETFYVRHGDVFVGLCLAGLAIAIAGRRLGTRAAEGRA